MDACNVGEGRLQFQDGYTNAIGHLFLVSVLPYLIPFAAMIYPIIVTFRALRNAQTNPEDAEDLDPEGEFRKDDLRYVLKSPTSRLSSRKITIIQFQDEGDIGPDHRGDLHGHAPPARHHSARDVSPHSAGERVLGLADALPGTQQLTMREKISTQRAFNSSIHVHTLAFDIPFLPPQFESVFHFMEEAWFLMVATLLLARDKAEWVRAGTAIARIIPRRSS